MVWHADRSVRDSKGAPVIGDVFSLLRRFITKIFTWLVCSSSLSQPSCFTPTAVTGFDVVADERTCYVICIYLDFDGESVFHRRLTLTDFILYTGVHTEAAFWKFVYNSLRSEHSSSNVCDTVRQAQRWESRCISADSSHPHKHTCQQQSIFRISQGYSSNAPQCLSCSCQAGRQGGSGRTKSGITGVLRDTNNQPKCVRPPRQDVMTNRDSLQRASFQSHPRRPTSSTTNPTLNPQPQPPKLVSFAPSSSGPLLITFSAKHWVWLRQPG